MNLRLEKHLVITLLFGILVANGVGAAAQQPDRTDHAALIKMLSDELRPHEGAGLDHYAAIKEGVSRDLLDELDAFVCVGFPGESTAAGVKAKLDAALDRKEGDLEQNVVFWADLPLGRFLVIGVELQGAGTNATEGYGNRVLFRAYKQSGGKFVYVASVENLASSALAGLNAEILKGAPVEGEFWFIAWADVPPLAPFKIATRIYAFDGKSFRTVWEPENFIASSIRDAVQATPDGRGFVVNEMPNFQSQTINHEQYYLTADGPQKVGEWTSERE